MTTVPDYLAPPKRFLEPIERISEALFGLIMVLTFTTTIAVEGDPDEAVQTMLVGALGCNVAWGIIDAVFNLMGCMAEKGRGHMRLKALRNTTDAREASRLVAEGLPPALRVSNGIGILLLFVLGYAYGKCIDRNPWSRAVLMVIVGVAMVALCNALGG